MAARRGPSELNLLLAVGKPCGITSHDVVARVRRVLGERRVGHAGTLDPMASGLMVVGVGQATRLLGLLALDTKSYVADISFGSETNTDDAEGEVVRSSACPPELASEEFARTALARLVGPAMQVPPAFSAISVGGVRSYKRARAGEDVELPARPIRIEAAELLAVSTGDDDTEDGAAGTPVIWTVSFTVSKGTYIRAIARDLGRMLGCAAHLSALCRTASGAITLACCQRIDELDAARAREAAIDPVVALGLPALEVGRDALADIACGRAVRVPRSSAASELVAALSAAGSVIGSAACAVAGRDAAGRDLHAPETQAGGPSSPGLDAHTGLTGAIALVSDGALAAIARPSGDRLVMEHVFPQPVIGVRSRPRARV